MKDQTLKDKAQIKIEAESRYVPEQSDPKANYYFFAYRIKITNMGKEASQLLNRHWVITDGHGRVNEVKGEGVVGAQPTIEPGETYEYSSFCPLETPTGIMTGSYEMMRKTGEKYNVEIPSFFLVEPSSFH